MKADPSWRRQEMLPVSLTARLAEVPRKMPKAVHSCVCQQITYLLYATVKKILTCQHMTKPPRMIAGVFSAQNMGMVEAFRPIPIPRRRRVTKS